jgi:hypothetical protein
MYLTCNKLILTNTIASNTDNQNTRTLVLRWAVEIKMKKREISIDQYELIQKQEKEW